MEEEEERAEEVEGEGGVQCLASRRCAVVALLNSVAAVILCTRLGLSVR